MNKIERIASGEKHIQQANRVFTVSLAQPDEIYEAFGNKSPQKEISILRFYLGLKGEEENYRYTLLGGKIAPLENPSEALVREIVEEAGISPLGLPYHTEIGRWQYPIPKKTEEREIILTYQPILPQQAISIGDPKIQQIVILTWPQLDTLIKKGELGNIPIEGHLTLSPKEEINISQEDFERQKSALTKGLSWMGHIEIWLQKKFQEIFNQNPQISYEEFEKEYQRILSRFMRRGIEVALSQKKLKEQSNQEILPILKALNEGYLGRDILYFLPQLAKYGLDWSGLEETTEGTKTFVNFLKSVFDSFGEKWSFLEKISDSNIPLSEKHNLLISLDNHFKEILTSIFGLKEEELIDALEMGQNFYKELLTDVKIDDEGPRGLYQDYVLTNEINNAHYGQLLMLFLGYDTKSNNPEEMKKIRFEAGRQLLILLKTLSIYNLYQRHLSQAKTGIAQTFINNLGRLAEEEFIELEPGKIMRIRKRKLLIPNFENFEVIIDGKPNKSFSSFLRKAFFEIPEKVVDWMSVNLVLDFKHNPKEPENLLSLLDMPQETKEDILKKLGISPDDERYQKCISQKGIISSLMNWVREQFPNCQVEIVERKDYGIPNFVCQNPNDSFSGYRPGSQSNRFLRTKIILRFDDEPLELVIYPFRTTKEFDNYHWGWKEKIKDDTDYNQRRLFASENGILSFYDLLFPPEIYPSHYKQKINSRYHK